MIPFSQTDLNFVDTLTIHPSQQKTQNQHFVTTSTLHPSSLSVVEAAEGENFTALPVFLTIFTAKMSCMCRGPTQSNVRYEVAD